MAGAFAKIESHEELCAERYETIHEKLGDLKTDAKTQNRLVMGVLLALLGWMGVQLWNGQVSRTTQTVQVSAPASR